MSQKADFEKTNQWSQQLVNHDTIDHLRTSRTQLTHPTTMEPPEPFPRIPPTPPSQQSFQDAPTHHKVRRPVSFYENWTSDIRDDHPTKVNLKRSRTFHDPPDVRGSPSLVYTMKTTVPQSVRSSLNPERHIPTRSSLRHSRMIGLKQTCKGKMVLFG